MKLKLLTIMFITILINGCASPYEELMTKAKQERAKKFSENGACLIFYKFVNLSVLKNVGSAFKSLNSVSASAFMEDGKIIITYADDSLILNPIINEIAISESKKITAKINEQNLLGIGYVWNDHYHCVEKRSSEFIKLENIDRVSANQPN